MSENGLTIKPEHIFKMSPTDLSVQEDFKQNIMELKDNLPSAIFCECDYMAISIIKSLHELNIHVPEDISIIGFDNIVESQIVSPELTTIHVKKDKIASLAVEKLIREIDENEEDKMKIFIDTELVKRKSCVKVSNQKTILT
ncbi:substrate-binding domain-containing protein [Niallia circulans]